MFVLLRYFQNTFFHGEHMSFSNDGSSGFAVLVGFGGICAILLALVVGHPKAATWIAEAVNAESPNAQGDVTASIGPASAPMRKPIESNAWTEVVDRAK
jgi:hypothetical protein